MKNNKWIEIEKQGLPKTYKHRIWVANKDMNWIMSFNHITNQFYYIGNSYTSHAAEHLRITHWKECETDRPKPYQRTFEQRFELFMIRNITHYRLDLHQAQYFKLTHVRNIYGDEINHLNCRSLWKDEKGRLYKVKQLLPFGATKDLNQ